MKLAPSPVVTLGVPRKVAVGPHHDPWRYPLVGFSRLQKAFLLGIVLSGCHVGSPFLRLIILFLEGTLAVDPGSKPGFAAGFAIIDESVRGRREFFHFRMMFRSFFFGIILWRRRFSVASSMG